MGVRIRLQISDLRFQISQGLGGLVVKIYQQIYRRL